MGTMMDGTMMDGTMSCGGPMMVAMGLFGVLLVAAVGLVAAAAIKVLRSGPPAAGHKLSAAEAR